MSSSKFLAGIFLGVAAGAALGILFAPDKGTETRKKIAKKGEDLTDSVKNKFNALGETLHEKYDNIKAEANHIIDKSKRKSEAANPTM